MKVKCAQRHGSRPSRVAAQHNVVGSHIVIVPRDVTGGDASEEILWIDDVPMRYDFEPESMSQ